MVQGCRPHGEIVVLENKAIRFSCIAHLMHVEGVSNTG